MEGDSEKAVSDLYLLRGSEKKKCRTGYRTITLPSTDPAMRCEYDGSVRVDSVVRN